MIIRIVFIIFLAQVFTSCYSLKGVSISPAINTYNVEKVKITTDNAPLEISQQFSEALKQKVQEESRLNLTSNDPDIIFAATINHFDYSSVAPEEGTTTTFNRLEIKVNVEYTNEVDEDESWKKNYSDFVDFPSSQSINDVQEDIIDSILEDIIDRIFNDAFTNW